MKNLWLYITLLFIIITLILFIHDYFELKWEVKHLKDNIRSIEEDHGIYKGSEKEN